MDLIHALLFDRIRCQNIIIVFKRDVILNKKKQYNNVLMIDFKIGEQFIICCRTS